MHAECSQHLTGVWEKPTFSFPLKTEKEQNSNCAHVILRHSQNAVIHDCKLIMVTLFWNTTHLHYKAYDKKHIGKAQKPLES